MDVSRLGVAFDTTGLKAADAALDKTTQAAGRTADATAKVSTASSRMAAEIQRAVQTVAHLSMAIAQVATAMQQQSQRTEEGSRRTSALEQAMKSLADRGLTPAQKAARAYTEAAQAMADAQRQGIQVTEAHRAGLRALFDAYSRVSTETGKATDAGQRATGIFGRLSTSIGPIGASMVMASAGMAGFAIGTAGAIQGAQAFVREADKVQQTIARLAANLGSMEDARKVWDQLSDGARRTGTSATDAAAAFIRFDMAARSLGRSREETVRFTQTLQQLAVVSGSTATEANNAFVQLGQGLASGRLQGDELRSIFESMPQIIDLLSKSIGKTVGEIRQMGTEGKLTPQVIFDAILKGQAEVERRFSSMPLTVDRAAGMMAASFQRLVQRVDESLGISNRVAQVFAALADAAGKAADAMAPPTVIDRLREVEARIKAITDAEAEQARRRDEYVQRDLRAARERQGGTAAPRPLPVDRTPGVPSESDLAQLQRLRAELQQLAQVQGAGEMEAAAAAAAMRQYGEEMDRVSKAKEAAKAATEALGMADEKVSQMIEGLRTIVAAGADAFRIYGISAQQAGVMIEALQGKIDPVANAIRGLNAQIAALEAGAPGSLANRQQAAIQAAGGANLSLDQQAEIAQGVARLAQAEALREAQDKLRQSTEALALARANGNRAEERRLKGEIAYQQVMVRSGNAEAAAIARQAAMNEVTATSISQGGQRFQQLRDILRPLEANRRAAEAMAAAEQQGGVAVAEARRQQQAKTEALKAGVEGSAAYNAALARTTEELNRTAEAEAKLAAAKAQRGIDNETALIQREMELLNAAPELRAAELEILRTRQQFLEQGVRLSEEEQRAIEESIRARERAREELRRTRQVWDDLGRMAEQSFDRLGQAITDAFVNGSKQATKLKDIVRGIVAELAQYFIRLAAINPILNGVFGGNRATLGSIGSVMGGNRVVAGPSGVGGASADGGGFDMSNMPLGSIRNLFGGSSTTAWFAPGYQVNTGIGFADSALNTPIWGSGNVSANAGGVAVGPGMTYGQLGMGALGILGGAYGLYTGIQTGGARGFAQGVGGVAGIAGGASGLALGALGGVGTAATAGAAATGATAAIGAGAATALGAIATVAPYIAAIAAIVAMLLPAQKASNAAAGALVNLYDGAVTNMDSGKSTGGTRDARDAMARAIQDTVNQVSKLVGGVRPSGQLEFELGQRDPSRFFLSQGGSKMDLGSAQPGDAEAMTRLFERGILEAYRRTPGLPEVQRSILAYSGDSLEKATQLLQATQQIATQYGDDALNLDRNRATRQAANSVGSGNTEQWIGVIASMAELTSRYGDKIMNSADVLKAIQAAGSNASQIVANVQWVADVYKPLSEAPEQVSQMAAAVEALRDQYDAAIRQARLLGLEEGKLRDRRREVLMEMRRDAREALASAARNLSGLGWVDQVAARREQTTAQWKDLKALGITGLEGRTNPFNLMMQELEKTFAEIDLASLKEGLKAFQKMEDMEPVVQALTEAIAKATAAQNEAIRSDYDARMRAAQGLGAVNQVLDAIKARDATAEQVRGAGRDPMALFSAEMKALFEGLDTETLRRTLAALRTLDRGAAALAEAALESRLAAEEQQKAAEKLADLQSAGKGIREYLDSLTSTGAAGASPRDQFQAAFQQYNRDLRLGQGGNMDALGRLPEASQRLLDAARQMFGSGERYQQIRAQIIEQLGGLPATKSYDQLMLEEMRKMNTRGITVAVTAPITALIDKVTAAPGLGDKVRAAALSALGNLRGTVTAVGFAAGVLPATRARALALLDKLRARIDRVVFAPGVVEAARLAAVNALDAIRARVGLISIAPGVTDALKRKAFGMLDDISAAVAAITVSPAVTDAAKLQAVEALDDISAAIGAITVAEGVTEDAKDQAMEALSDIAGNVSRITFAAGVTARAKRAAIDALDGIAGRITRITVATGVIPEVKSFAVARLSDIAATISRITLTPGILQSVKLLANERLSDLAAVVEKITLAKNIAAEAKLDILNRIGALQVVIDATANLAGIPENQRNVIFAATGRITRALSILASGGTLTADQRAVLTAATGTLTRTLNNVINNPNLTDAQREALRAAAGVINRRINNTVTTAETVTVSRSVDEAIKLRLDNIQTFFYGGGTQKGVFADIFRRLGFMLGQLVAIENNTGNSFTGTSAFAAGPAPEPPKAEDRTDEVLVELRATVRVLQAGFTQMAKQNDDLKAEVAELRRRVDPNMAVPR